MGSMGGCQGNSGLCYHHLQRYIKRSCDLNLADETVEPDMSIWEVRNKKQNFVYSKIMLWVAFDRGLRLSEKRCLPCPNRAKWMQIRDEIYEEIMEKGLWPRLCI
jgi:GH15 family glucan-1,4-alpha-glucosidase